MTVNLDAERQAKASRYATRKRLLLLGQFALAAAYLLVFILTGLAIDLRDAVGPVPGGQPGVVAAYFIVVTLAFAVLSFPFALLSGWVLPRSFGLSVQSAPQWFVDWLKGEAIGLVLGLVMAEVVFALLQALPQIWWLVTGVLYLFFVVVLAQIGPVLLLPLFFKLTPLDDPELVERLKAMARQAGTRVQGVFRMNLSAKTTAANAALAGLGSTRQVILGDTLLNRYTPEEIEVIFAHELGHHVHHDIPRMIAGQTIVTLVSLFVANQLLTIGVQTFEYRSIADVAVLPFLVLVLGAVGTIVSPLLNWASRGMENAADCYALQMTRAPAAFESTMIQLANQNLAVFSPPRWEEILFYDHPSVVQRVNMARRFARTGQCGG